MLETLRLIKHSTSNNKTGNVRIPAEAMLNLGCYDSTNPALEPTGSYSGGSGSDNFNKNYLKLLWIRKLI